MMICNLDHLEYCLELLNKRFQTTPLEKYPRAMLSITLERALNDVLGKEFCKQRLSDRLQKKVYNRTLEILRAKYGRWINLLNWKAKDPYSIKFNCNLLNAYKNELGTLYTANMARATSDIFYTPHCFERLEERVDKLSYEIVKNSLKKSNQIEPTAADILFTCVDICSFEYMEYENFKYLNIRIGILVLEDFNDFYIAKTFLTPEMMKRPLQWYLPIFKSYAAERFPWRHYTSTREIMELSRIPIDAPTLYYPES